MTSIETTGPGKYTYRPLNSANEEIRLVTIKRGSGSDQIQCTLTHVSLRDLPQYEALSYVWGDSENRTQLVLEGFNFSVTRNLGHALRFLRFAEEDRTMWIDAICINQDDSTERSAQVQLMRRIFHDAQQIVSWLEDDKKEASDVVWLLSEAKTHRFSHEFAHKMLSADSETQRKLGYITRMLNTHKYWYRVWITQEVALARKGIVQCDEFTMPYEDFISFSQMFHKAIKNTNWIIRADGVAEYLPSNVISVKLRRSQIVERITPGTQLLTLLKMNRRKEATDPRDKAFALLGLSDMDSTSHDGLKIDYSDECTKRDVYVGVVRAVVDTTSRLDIICESDPDPDKLDLEPSQWNLEVGLPSWAPDWTINPRGKLESLEKTKEGAAGRTLAAAGFSLDGNILSAAGFCVGTVGKLGRCLPIWKSTTDLQTFNDVEGTVHDWYELLKDGTEYGSELGCLFSRTILLGLDGSMVLDHLLPVESHRDQALDSSTASLGRSLVQGSITKESLLRAIHSWLSDCQFFLGNPTKKYPFPKDHTPQLMGVGPRGLQENDMICVLLGCKSPVVIRPKGDHFRFIAAVYVDSLWDGHAIDDLENGIYDLETFDIH